MAYVEGIEHQLPFSFDQHYPLDQSAHSIQQYGFQLQSDSLEQQEEQPHDRKHESVQTVSPNRPNMSCTPPAQQDPEEVDSASRPRLTTQQTNLLEGCFRQDPKPQTVEKKRLAQQIGLAVEKVNNWYQNRRAKEKNTKSKRESYDVLDFNYPPSWIYQGLGFQPDFQYSSQPLAFSPHSTGIMSPPLQVEMDPQAAAPVGNVSNGIMANNQCHSMFQSGAVHRPPQISNSNDQQVPMASQAGLNGPTLVDQSTNSILDSQQNYVLPSVEMDNMSAEDLAAFEAVMQGCYGNDPVENQELTATTFAPWEDQLQTMGTSWNHTQQFESPISDDHLPLQQSVAPDMQQQQQQESHQVPINNAGPFTLASSQPLEYTPRAVSQAETGGMQTQFLDRSVDSSPPSCPTTVVPLSREAFSRRGSDSSELANNLNTIQLQRVRSQQTSDDEFKSPQIPRLGLAARRKRARPAALGTISMRSQSCTGPQNLSPVMKTAPLGLSNSVRRIKSTGNNLNVIGGRIQKAQRSPLYIQSFQEAGVYDALQSMSGPPTGSSFVQPNSGATPITPQSPMPADPSFSNGSSKTLVHSSSNPNMLPTQHQQPGPFGNNTRSPETTPFPQPQVFASHYQPQSHFMAPPQSAPAHMVSFPNNSPPFHALPGTPLGSFPAHPNLGEPSYFCYPEPHLQHQLQQQQQLHQPAFDYPHQHSLYGFQQQQHHPHIMHDSPPLHGVPGPFFAPPPPPPLQQHQQQHKELEVVMTTFPKPAGEHAPPREVYRPKQYTFQNSTPGDY